MRPNPYTIMLFSILFALVSCGEKKDTNSPKPSQQNSEKVEQYISLSQDQFLQGKMKLESLEEKTFPSIVSTNGMIDVPPENRAVVSAKMGGFIKKISLLTGDKVSKGQPILILENPDFITLQQQYLELHEQLKFLEAEYERKLKMKAEEITSQKDFLKAQSDYKSAVARYKGLEEQLRLINISPATVRGGTISPIATVYAPISGSISKVNVNTGSYVSPSTEILEIIDDQHIHLELLVFEKEILKIEKGQTIDFRIPEASSRTYKAKVHLVGTLVEENRTVKVHAHIDHESEALFLVGMFVTAEIVTESRLEWALPTEAIAEKAQKSYVLLLDKKEGDTYFFHPEEVVVKARYDGYAKVTGKFISSRDHQFLSHGAYNLLAD